jgi:oligopeptide transport system ATP-binding protein
MDAAAVLEVNGLDVGFRTPRGAVHVIRDVSFSIASGETVVLVGESGSGKSVTALALMGLLDKSAATVRAGGILFRGKDGRTQDLAKLSERKMRKVRGNDIAMIFQEPMSSLDPVFTIGQQIGEAIVVHQGVGWAEARRRAQTLLEVLGFPDPARRLDNYPFELSGGMRQRVMIAMAIACRPTLLIADEPTTALDVTIQAQILHQLTGLVREFGMSMLFITHNLGVAAQIAQRIVVMYAGRIVEDGPVRDVFASPRMPYTRALLASVPRLDDDQDEQALRSIRGSIPPLSRLPPGCSFNPRCDHALAPLCTSSIPPLEAVGERHRAACLRWRDIGGQP